MIRTLIAAFAVMLAGPAFAPFAAAETSARPPQTIQWSFEGPFGRYDRAALQRGFQVYHEVCSSCHSMRLLTYRNLGEPGGPFEAVQEKNKETGADEFAMGAPGEGRKSVNPNDNPYLKMIAADYQIDEVDPQTGDTVQRKARPSDHFHAPFANDGAARGANGGALPPDMSVLAKARKGGPNYIRSLVTGYERPPEGLQVPAGKYYNPYLPGDLSGSWRGDPHKVPPGGLISMPPQLTPDRVTYSDGTKATPIEMATDVATFLEWASDPKLETRNALGLQVMAYLLLVTFLTYLAYRQIWKDVKH